MEKENLSIEEAYRTLVMIWFGLFSSQIIFLVIVYFAKPELYKFSFSKPFLGENSIVIFIFALLAVTNLFISFVIGRKKVNEGIENKSVGLIQTGMIIGLALCESVSIFGLLLALTYDFQYFFVWIALGMFGMILHFPKRQNIQMAMFKKEM